MSACAITTTTETSTFYKCCLLKTGDFVLKTPACFAMSFGLIIFSHKVFFLADIIICSFNNNELRNAPMPKLFICMMHWPVASAQFYGNNNLTTPGTFGTFSRCSDEVSS